MIPSVKDRQKGAYDFKTYYEGICELQNVAPVQAVTCHLAEGILDVNVDRIRTPDWDPIVKALRINKNLNFVAFRSFWCGTNKQDVKENRLTSYRRPTPALLSSSTIKRTLCRALRSALRISTTLSFLELQNIPLNAGEITCLCEGISKNRTLRHLSFEGSSLGDIGLEHLCRAIRNAPDLMTLNLTACKIASKGIEHLTELIQFQAMQRHGAAWADSLRYRLPNLDQLGGLRRITLNDNPGVGDAGAIAMAEALADDLWVKAIDMQSCELTDSSARVWLNVLVGPLVKTEKSATHGNSGNRSLFIVDLRRNPLITRDLLRAVTERALMNGEGKQTEYNWLRAGPQAPTKLCSGVVVYPWPGIAGFDMHHLRVSPSSRRSGSIESRGTGDAQPRRHQSLGPQSARSNNSSPRAGVGIRARDGRVTGRPVFIPAGGKLRSRSLVSRAPRYCSTRSPRFASTRTKNPSSRPPSVLAAWRPAGKARPKTAPQLADHSSQLTSANGGIPWRAAARASRCCRGYPSYQHPGQTCLEARALRINPQCDQGSTPSNPGQNPRSRAAGEREKPLNSVHKNGWIGPNEAFMRPIITANRPSQKTQARVQAQVKKLMMRVAQLEIQLAKEKQKTRESQECKKCQKIHLGPSQIDIGQNNTVDRLDEILQELQDLFENLNAKRISLSTNQECHLEKLRSNLHKLCGLVDQSFSNTVREFSSTRPTNWATEPHGDHCSRFTSSHHATWIADAAEYSANSIPQNDSTNAVRHDHTGYQQCAGQDSGINIQDTAQMHFTKAFNANWEKYAETKAAQTSTEDSDFKSKMNMNENCSIENENHTTSYLLDKDIPSKSCEPSLQVNNHNSNPAAEPRVKICQRTNIRNEPMGCDGSSDATRKTIDSVWCNIDVGKSDNFDSLSHLEKLSSEANKMYAELKAATYSHTSKCEYQNDTTVETVVTIPNSGNAAPFQGGSHAEHVVQNDNSIQSSDILTDKLLNPCGQTKNTLLTRQSKSDEELISDEEDSLQLWCLSEKSTPRRSGDNVYNLNLTSKSKSHNNLIDAQKKSTAMDDTELTIRDNLFENSDEDLDDILIDYSLGDSDEEDNDDEDFIDFSDLALSAQTKRNHISISDT